jgi:hypothetical protein
MGGCERTTETLTKGPQQSGFFRAARRLARLVPREISLHVRATPDVSGYAERLCSSFAHADGPELGTRTRRIETKTNMVSYKSTTRPRIRFLRLANPVAMYSPTGFRHPIREAAKAIPVFNQTAGVFHESL